MRLNNVSEAQMLVQLKADYPQLVVAPMSEFTGHGGSTGLWLRNTEDAVTADGDRIYDAYTGIQHREFGVEIKFAQWLRDRGWFAEPYDAGTLMFYPI